MLKTCQISSNMLGIAAGSLGALGGGIVGHLTNKDKEDKKKNLYRILAGAAIGGAGLGGAGILAGKGINNVRKITALNRARTNFEQKLQDQGQSTEEVKNLIPKVVAEGVKGINPKDINTSAIVTANGDLSQINPDQVAADNSELLTQAKIPKDVQNKLVENYRAIVDDTALDTGGKVREAKKVLDKILADRGSLNDVGPLSPANPDTGRSFSQLRQQQLHRMLLGNSGVLGQLPTDNKSLLGGIGSGQLTQLVNDNLGKLTSEQRNQAKQLLDKVLAVGYKSDSIGPINPDRSGEEFDLSQAREAQLNKLLARGTDNLDLNSTRQELLNQLAKGDLSNIDTGSVAEAFKDDPNVSKVVELATVLAPEPPNARTGELSAKLSRAEALRAYLNEKLLPNQEELDAMTPIDRIRFPGKVKKLRENRDFLRERINRVNEYMQPISDELGKLYVAGGEAFRLDVPALTQLKVPPHIANQLAASGIKLRDAGDMERFLNSTLPLLLNPEDATNISNYLAKYVDNPNSLTPDERELFYELLRSFITSTPAKVKSAPRDFRKLNNLFNDFKGSITNLLSNSNVVNQHYRQLK